MALSPPLLRELDLSSGGACRLDRPMLLLRTSPGTCCASYIGTDLLYHELDHLHHFLSHLTSTCARWLAQLQLARRLSPTYRSLVDRSLIRNIHHVSLRVPWRFRLVREGRSHPPSQLASSPGSPRGRIALRASTYPAYLHTYPRYTFIHSDVCSHPSCNLTER